MSIKEIFLYTRRVSTAKQIYISTWNEVENYYYNIPESLFVLESLLKRQYGSMYQVTAFLQRVYRICGKLLPKVNTMYVLGPPNSGKNYFFDCVMHAFINFGTVRNFNKFENFPLQNCLDKRILMWNEPNFEPGATETLKLLIGGGR